MSDFETWLDRHKDKFLTYTTEEIADLAIACGFSSLNVAAWVLKNKFGRAA